MIALKFVHYEGDSLNHDWLHMFGLPDVSFVDGVASQQNKSVLEWCADQFGEQADRFRSDDQGRWVYLGLGEYTFRNATDATAFRLRWC
jgi:hypothetical protein